MCCYLIPFHGKELVFPTQLRKYQESLPIHIYTEILTSNITMICIEITVLGLNNFSKKEKNSIQLLKNKLFRKSLTLDIISTSYG